jgi:FixJ family two-component response regulator
LTEPDGVVFVVDDDVSVREALEGLIRSAGLRVETFASAQEFGRKEDGDGHHVSRVFQNELTDISTLRHMMSNTHDRYPSYARHGRTQ